MFYSFKLFYIFKKILLKKHVWSFCMSSLADGSQALFPGPLTKSIGFFMKMAQLRVA